MLDKRNSVGIAVFVVNGGPPINLSRGIIAGDNVRYYFFMKFFGILDNLDKDENALGILY